MVQARIQAFFRVKRDANGLWKLCGSRARVFHPHCCEQRAGRKLEGGKMNIFGAYALK